MSALRPRTRWLGRYHTPLAVDWMASTPSHLPTKKKFFTYLLAQMPRKKFRNLLEEQFRPDIALEPTMPTTSYGQLENAASLVIS